MKNFISLSILTLIFFASLNSLLAKESNVSKSFACKLITKDGSVYQSVLLRSDWKLIGKSEMKTSKLGDNTSFSVIEPIVYLNHNSLNINLNANSDKSITIKLFNLTGIQFNEWIVNLFSGSNYIVKEINELPNGVYLVHINDGTKNYKIYKLIK